MSLGRQYEWSIEKEFLDLKEAEGVSDQGELNAVLERAVTLKALMKAPARVGQVAEFIARHYREKIEPMGYKAFVVAVARGSEGLDRRFVQANQLVAAVSNRAEELHHLPPAG